MFDKLIGNEACFPELYVRARGGFKRQLTKAMRSGNAVRKSDLKEGLAESGQVAKYPSGQGTKPKVIIANAPEQLSARIKLVEWESDLLMGANNRSAIATLVERSTGYLMLCKLKGGFSAEIVAEAITRRINTFPSPLIGSLSSDEEPTQLSRQRIAENLPPQVFFYDPNLPRPKGPNENTNGLLRQYFPKGTSLSKHTEEELREVEWQMNNRPRQRYRFLTPEEVIEDLVRPSWEQLKMR